MSSVIAVPELIATAATNLTIIDSTLSAAHEAAVAPIVAVLPAAADEVSAGIAQLFSKHALDYQETAGQAAAFQEQFVQRLSGSARSYASAEAASAAALQPWEMLASAVTTGIDAFVNLLQISLNAAVDGLSNLISYFLSLLFTPIFYYFVSPFFTGFLRAYFQAVFRGVFGAVFGALTGPAAT